VPHETQLPLEAQIVAVPQLWLAQQGSVAAPQAAHSDVDDEHRKPVAQLVCGQQAWPLPPQLPQVPFMQACPLPEQVPPAQQT